MLLLNFTHPLTVAQQNQLNTLLGADPEVRVIPVQIDQAQPLAPQVVALIDAAGLSPTAWQSTPILINPPGLSTVTALLLAELHRRIGRFPALVRIRPTPGSTPTSYEVAEIINLPDDSISAH
ncbi:MAG: hypothetical protein HGA19_21450 [Oscillochloris sp.]|nr:hypothetical protein [Oscillochloris sp.]